MTLERMAMFSISNMKHKLSVASLYEEMSFAKRLLQSSPAPTVSELTPGKGSNMRLAIFRASLLKSSGRSQTKSSVGPGLRMPASRLVLVKGCSGHGMLALELGSIRLHY